MDTTITFVAGIGEKPYPVLSAYDDAAALTFSGLTVPDGSYVYVTTRDGQTALANRALVATGAATVNLNTSAIDAIFADATRSANYPCLVTVRAIATGKIVGWCLAEVAPAANPNADVVHVGIDYATTADIADLQAQINALEVGALDLSALDARPDAITAATLFATQEEPAEGETTTPTKSPGTRILAWLGGVFEAIGTAAGLMSTHTTAHPIPTTRDDRNEAAQSAASQAEAEAGTETAVRSWSPLRLWQGVAGKLLSILTAAGTVLYRGSSGLSALTLRTAVRATGTADDTSLATEAAIRAQIDGRLALSLVTTAGDTIRATGSAAAERVPALTVLAEAGAGDWAPVLKANSTHTVVRSGIWTDITPSGLSPGEGCSGRITGQYAAGTAGLAAAFDGALDDIGAAVVDFVIYRIGSTYYGACREVV